MTPPPAVIAFVEGIDAAIYGYSVAGARVAGAGRRRALEGLSALRASRDRGASLIVESGGTPPGSAVAYTLPVQVTSPATAREVMTTVDNRLVGLAAEAAAALQGGERRWAARTGVEAAMRAVAWGAPSQAFPTGPPVSSAGPSPSAG